jgi:hypothetical protein
MSEIELFGIPMNPLLLVGIMSLLLVALLIWTAHQLTRGRNHGPRNDDWWEEFSPDRYRPMSRLLATADAAWLRDSAALSAKDRRRFRTSRIRIFRQYLREMTVDFAGLQAVGRAMILSGSVGPEFQEELFRHQLKFTRSLWLVRVQLFFYQFGLTQVDASGLLESLQGVSLVFRVAPSAA